MDDLLEREREIRDDVYGRDNFQDRQLGDWRQRVRPEVQGCRAGPGALQIDFLKVLLHELTNSRRAVDVRDDFEEEVRSASEAFTLARSAARCL